MAGRSRDHLAYKADALRAAAGAVELHFGIFDVVDLVTIQMPRASRDEMAGRKNFADSQSAQNLGALAREIFQRRG